MKRQSNGRASVPPCVERMIEKYSSPPQTAPTVPAHVTAFMNTAFMKMVTDAVRAETDKLAARKRQAQAADFDVEAHSISEAMAAVSRVEWAIAQALAGTEKGL